MFKLLSGDSGTSARLGILKTVHGNVKTPFFMPVATKGSVKFATNEELERIGFEALISNAFVLSLKPGLETIEKAGGLHKFINWGKSIFTDSGGFQLLSKEFLLRVNDKGVWFRNPFDKSRTFLSPEQAVEIQNRLNSDVAMCLDDVPHYGNKKSYYAGSLKRTLLWAERCKDAHNEGVHKNEKQMLFAISQGGTFKDLREQGIRGLNKMDFDGIALGGLCIGEKPEIMHSVVSSCNKLIPEEKPRYLMGLGSPKEILEAISLGVDIFDSCFPTRTARHCLALASGKSIQIDRTAYARDFRPLDGNCGCFVCREHSRAYLHHLVKTKEENGLKYLTYHNLWFTQKLIEGARKAIREQRFREFCRKTPL